MKEENKIIVDALNLITLITAFLVAMSVFFIGVGLFSETLENERVEMGGVCGNTDEIENMPADIEKGKLLFKINCKSCHNADMASDMTGPALGRGLANWKNYPKKDLYQWIRNSQSLIADGHPRAVELWEKWQPTVMTSFPELSNEDIDGILAYIGFEQ